MALLDVSEILTDPDFVDTFVVVRRQEGISDKGRAVLTLTGLAASGVVNMAGPNDLRRLPDAQLQDRTLSIVSRFPFFGASVGYQPDLIQWREGLYIVSVLDLYPQYGRGFYQVIAPSIDLQNYPVLKPGQRLDIDFIPDSSTLGA